MQVDALLVVSFGGPTAPDEVMPFLRRVTAGRGVPDERLAAVARQYDEFGGVSPLPAQNEQLVRRLRAASVRRGEPLPVYLGNRNSAPELPDVLAQMATDGVERAGVFITSAFSSYSGCRQYRENVAAAQQQVPTGPQLSLLPSIRTHPVYVELVSDSIIQVGAETLLFATHSLPVAGSELYVQQQRDMAAAVVAALAADYGQLPWELVYQSRSGPPHQPWLEPDVGDAVRQLAESGAKDVTIVPLGFLAENAEIRWDLDVVAQELAQEVGVRYRRAPAVQGLAGFADMVLDLVADEPRLCAPDCCPNPRQLLPAFADSPVGAERQEV